MGGGSVSWDVNVVDGGNGWVKSNPFGTRVDTLRVGGDFDSIGGGFGKTCFSVATIIE
jgi:hypothetical protein